MGTEEIPKRASIFTQSSDSEVPTMLRILSNLIDSQHNSNNCRL